MSSLASSWRRVRDPGVPALHRALRVAIAATCGFLAGRYLLDEPQTAVFATLTPIALLGLGQVAGPLPVRARAYAIAVVVAAGATVLGTLASDDTLAASLTLFAGAIVASQAGIAGSNPAGLARSVLLMLVVSAGIPVEDAEIGERLVGVAIGGVGVLATTLLLWPDYPDVDLRRRIGAALAPLAEAAHDLAAGAQPTEALERSRGAIAGARAFGLRIAERPLGAARVAAAERELFQAAVELRELLGAIDGAEQDAADRAVLRAAAEALDGAAHVLGKRGAAPPDPAALRRAWDAYDAASGARLAGLISRAAPPAIIAGASERVFRLRRLALVAAAAVGQARAASGHGPREAARSSASRVAGQLSVRVAPGSVLLHDGLRLALGLAAARAIAGAFDLEHGFWVVFATLTVTRASAHGTRANAARAVLGTAIGAALATVILFAFDAGADVHVLMVPVLVFAAIYGSAISFVCGQVGFTLLIVELFNLLAPPHWDTALIRLEDVAIGAAVGLAIGLAVWPRGPAAQLRRALAQAIDAGATYARAVASGLLDPRPARLAPTRRHAVAAARRAEDVFTAYLDEAAPPPAALERWSVLLERTHRLWYEASVASERAHHAPHECAPLAAALRRAVDDIAAGFSAAGDALRRRESPAGARDPAGVHLGPEALACVGSAAGSEDSARLDGVVHLLGLRAWIVELGRELDGMRGAVAALTGPSATG
jgi:uncharacterized membrane protein YccC